MLLKFWGSIAIFGVALAKDSPLPTVQNNAYPPIAKRNGRASYPGADFNIDFLYWLAQEDSLDYAYTTGVSSETEHGKYYQPEYNWQSGYRIGLSCYTAYDGWDVFAQYTWYKNSTQSSINLVDNLKPVWKITGPTSLTQSISSAASNWSLDFNAIDFLLRRKFCLSPKFIVHPGLGLKGVDFGQTYMVSYDGRGNATMKTHQHTYGVGVCGLIASHWYFTPSLSVYGKVALSTLWFKSNIHRKDFSEDYTFGTETVNLNVEKNASYVAPVFETALGFSLKSSLYKKKIQALLILGYEFQVWEDSNQFSRTLLDSNGSWGALTLQGLTLRGQFEF